MSRQQIKFADKQHGIQFQLWRLEDQEYRVLRDYSLPIEEDGLFLLRLLSCEQNTPDALSLGKALVLLEHLLGESSHYFDDWKSSFSFPCLLIVQRAIGRFFYLLRIEDYRGHLSFPLYRILDQGTEGYRLEVVHKPFAEFSRAEINFCLAFLYGYLTGFAQVFCQNPFQPFYREVRSNLVLYGYGNGEFFEWSFTSPEDYDVALKSLKTGELAELGEDQEQARIRDEIASLLRSIVPQLNEETE